MIVGSPIALLIMALSDTMTRAISPPDATFHTGSMLVQHLAGYIPEDREEKTRDFFDLNLKLSYDFPIFKSATLQVNAGIQNIFDSYQDDFDKGAHRDAGYIYGPGIPRSYFVGCKISY